MAAPATSEIHTDPEARAKYVSAGRLCDRLGITPAMLKTWRVERGLPYIKIRHRTLMYDLAAVDRWIEAQA